MELKLQTSWEKDSGILNVYDEEALCSSLQAKARLNRRKLSYTKNYGLRNENYNPEFDALYIDLGMSVVSDFSASC